MVVNELANPRRDCVVTGLAGMRFAFVPIALTGMILFATNADAHGSRHRREMGNACKAVVAGKAEVVTLTTRTGTGHEVPLEGILTKPEGAAPFPAVILLHGGKGMRAPHCYRDVQETLAEWGYLSLLIDSFSAAAPRLGRAHSPTIADRVRDARSAARFLAARDDVNAIRIGLMGWSLGGTAAIMAVSGEGSPGKAPAETFAAVIALVPICSDVVKGLASPLLVLVGGADRLLPPEKCKAMRIEGDNPPSYEIRVFPGAGHTFFSTLSRAYNAGAARAANVRMKNFLSKHLGPR